MRFTVLPLVIPVAFSLLVACGESRRGGGGNPPPNNPPPPAGGQICGNGAINGLEPCDGSAFRGSRECASVNLGMGQISCTATCQLDLTTCSFSDYCTANNLYSNGECDNCELLGGVPDPECMTACSMNGTCGDRFDELTGQWTCKRRGMNDPDCGMCGNQIIEGNELCDGMTQRPQSARCEDWGFEDGTLGCSNCLPTFASCRAARCGDNMIEGAEQCEAGNFQGLTCEGMGFAGGMLTCTSTCGVSYASCVAPGCGNNIIEANRDEECEGTNLNGATCDGMGFAGGTLSCNAGCTLDTTQCVNPGCGNNIIESPQETCEGANLNGGTCMNEGFVGGTLTCSPSSCTFDTSACIAPGCGNNIIEAPNEQCEGTNLSGASCMTLGFVQGNLTCNGSCRYDTSQCIAPGCGNNIIEAPNEQCEGANLNGASCFDQGFLGGDLGCNSSCRFDTSMCTGRPCGDGVARGIEACDGSSFVANNDCNAYGLGFATMGCTSDCRLDFDSCGSSTDFCMANSFYNDGVCDACQEYGGNVDPDCTNGCGANGTCVSYFDLAISNYTCRHQNGVNDPDCGCGNGTLAPNLTGGLTAELCDGTQFASGLDNCAAWNFSGGSLSCGANCLPNFGACAP